MQTQLGGFAKVATYDSQLILSFAHLLTCPAAYTNQNAYDYNPQFRFPCPNYQAD